MDPDWPLAGSWSGTSCGGGLILRTRPGSSLSTSTSRPPQWLLLLLSLCWTLCLGLCLSVWTLLSRIPNHKPNPLSSNRHGAWRGSMECLCLKNCTPLTWRKIITDPQRTRATTSLGYLGCCCTCLCDLCLSVTCLALLGCQLLSFAFLYR